ACHLFNDPEDDIGIVLAASIHALKHVVIARFRTHEDHFESAVAHSSKCAIAKSQHRVGAAEAPPADAEFRDALAEFGDSAFLDEEIVGEKPHWGGAITPHEPLDSRGGASRGVSGIAPVHLVHDGAKIARERAAVTRMMSNRARPEKREPDISLHI